MMRSAKCGVLRSWLLATVVAAALASSLRAQVSDGGARAPRFLAASILSPSGTVPLNVARTAVLRRRIALDLNGVTLKDALTTIAQRGGLELAYAEGVVPLQSRVHLRAGEITVAGALTDVLVDANVDIVFIAPTRAILKHRSGVTLAPTGVVAGHITDAKTGDPVEGADLSLEDSRLHTTSNAKGVYRLAEVEPGKYTLSVRRVGYAKYSQPVVVPADGELTVDLGLQPVVTQLNEIVTTATGEQRRLELGHVVGVINADSLVKEAPVSSLSELLGGRVPGLQVFTTQGVVGGNVSLQVRGANSVLLSTQPIVIIDGVRYTSVAGVMTTSAAPFGSMANDVSSPLNDLNPNDLQSIEIVKGPSAATLYGTDAANGVIVITTKRGQPGPARWNAYGRAARSDIPAPDYLDTYWGWKSTGGVPSLTSPCSLSSLADGVCTQDSVTILPNPLTDPKLSIFGRAPRLEAGLNVSGGRQDLRYYFAGDYEDATGATRMPPELAEQLALQRGVPALRDDELEPNKMTKLNLRSNIAATFDSRTQVRVNTGYIRNLTRAVNMSPYATTQYESRPNAPYGRYSPPTEAFAQSSYEHADRFIATASGEWRATSWLEMHATAGLDIGARDRRSLVRSGEAAHGNYPGGAVEEDRLRQSATTADIGARIMTRRGRLSFRTAVGAQYTRTLNDELDSFGQGLPPGGTSVGEASFINSRQGYTETVTLGTFAEQTFGLNDRLFLTAAVRADGASAFGQDYDAAVYPKFSASWLASEEPFFPKVPGLDELRLRYAFGVSGQQPLPSWAKPQLVATQWETTPGQYTQTVSVDALGNPTLRPERVREHEFGFDLAALASRAQLGLTWYSRRTVDQIMPLSLAPGLGSTYENLGLTQQHGFELEFTGRLLDAKALAFDVRYQYSLHRTKLIDLGGILAPNTGLGVVEGYPLGGRFSAPIASFADANGDGIIVPSEVVLGPSVYGGESTPPKTQTISAVVSFFERRLRLSTLFERRWDYTQVDALQMIQCTNQRCRSAVDPTAPLEQQAQAAALNQYGAYLLLKPVDFTRLREMTAAFDLPTGMLRAMRVRSATLSLSGRNVALWSNFGLDPESAGVSGAQSYGALGIPQSRTWTLRLDLGF